VNVVCGSIDLNDSERPLARRLDACDAACAVGRYRLRSRSGFIDIDEHDYWDEQDPDEAVQYYNEPNADEVSAERHYRLRQRVLGRVALMLRLTLTALLASREQARPSETAPAVEVTPLVDQLVPILIAAPAAPPARQVALLAV
jgi:hypothetical protein